MRISVCDKENYWSRSINLESVGINTQAFTYAPANPVGRASRADMEVMMEDVIKFENQFPIQPGAQVPGRKRASSRMYALICCSEVNQCDVWTTLLLPAVLTLKLFARRDAPSHVALSPSQA